MEEEGAREGTREGTSSCVPSVALPVSMLLPSSQVPGTVSANCKWMKILNLWIIVNTKSFSNDRRDKPKGGSSGGLSLLNPSYLALGKGDSPGGDKKAITMGGEVLDKLIIYQQFNNYFPCTRTSK